MPRHGHLRRILRTRPNPLWAGPERVGATISACQGSAVWYRVRVRQDTVHLIGIVFTNQLVQTRIHFPPYGDRQQSTQTFFFLRWPPRKWMIQGSWRRHSPLVPANASTEAFDHALRNSSSRMRCAFGTFPKTFLN